MTKVPQHILDKWQPVLDNLDGIREVDKRKVTAVYLGLPHIEWWDDSGTKHITCWGDMTPEQREEAERNREKHESLLRKEQ